MPTALAMAGGGTIGGGLAGLCGGLLYGFIGASHGLAAGMGTISVLLVLTAISVLVAILGAAGVSAGVAATSLALRPSWLASGFGGVVGELVVGAVAKLLSLDAFTLLLGHAPGNITGAAEGAAIGSAVGISAWRAGSGSFRRGIMGAVALWRHCGCRSCCARGSDVGRKP